MSAHAAHGKSWASRGVDAVSLVVVFAIAFVATRLSPEMRDEAAVIGGLGFLLLAGTLMSDLVEVFKVPHLTGYLIAGILAGPYVFQILDEEAVKQLAPVNTLAISLITLAGGAELRLKDLRQGLKSLMSATALQTVIGVIVMTGIFYAVKPAFLDDLPPLAVFGVALLWGVLSVTRSPSALLGVLSQTRAKGPLARFAVQFIMTSNVVAVVALAAAITVARPLIDPAATMSTDAFRALGHQILGSVTIGTSLGLLLAAYVKLVGRQFLVVLVALGFGATEVFRYLRFDPMLAFLVAGFVVQNLSKQGDKLLHAIEETGGVVYVVFFAGAGAHLDVPLLRQYWLIALVLTASRAAVTYGASRLSSHLVKDPDAVRTWGWSPLIAQAGVALGIANAMSGYFPSFGEELGAIALACIGINEIVGPVLFKLALDRTGETREGAPSLSDADDAAT